MSKRGANLGHIASTHATFAARAAATTSRLLNPTPLPRLQMSGSVVVSGVPIPVAVGAFDAHLGAVGAGFFLKTD